MAECIRCKKSGFFLTVQKNGLCDTCTNEIMFDIRSRMKIINESFNIIQKSKNIDTVLSRSELINENLEYLTIYDGFEVVDINFKQLSKDVDNVTKERVFEILKTNFEQIKEKALTLNTSAAKLNQLSKLRIQVGKYYPIISCYEQSLTGMLKSIDFEETKIRFHNAVDKAKKYEFKGNNKKALDYYYDALYVLRTDKINDKYQSNLIRKTEEKIKSLGGEIREI